MYFKPHERCTAEEPKNVLHGEYGKAENAIKTASHQSALALR
jgi:hypothetical protein